MLPTHEHVEAYQGFEIYRRRPGFEYTPVMLGKVASFLVHGSEGQLVVFAFMYSLLAPFTPGAGNDGGAGGIDLNEGDLLAAALAVIEAAIDHGVVADRQDLTFELRDGVWTPVREPRWWISTF